MTKACRQIYIYGRCIYTADIYVRIVIHNLVRSIHRKRNIADVLHRRPSVRAATDVMHYNLFNVSLLFNYDVWKAVVLFTYSKCLSKLRDRHSNHHSRRRVKTMRGCRIEIMDR